MPKLFFYDTGLACSLLDLQSEEQLKSHYLLGGLFETFILSEIIKSRVHRGLRNNCYFWRDHKGLEIDCVVERGDHLTPVEIKSAVTYSESYFDNIRNWNKLSGNLPGNSYVIYGGEKSFQTKHGQILSWKDSDKKLTEIDQ